MDKMRKPEDLIKEAKAELAGGGFLPDYEPTWHPYYWLGRLRAAEEMVIGRDGVRRRNRKPKADRPAR